jgi:hypothetical protein
MARRLLATLAARLLTACRVPGVGRHATPPLLLALLLLLPPPVLLLLAAAVLVHGVPLAVMSLPSAPCMVHPLVTVVLLLSLLLLLLLLPPLPPLLTLLLLLLSPLCTSSDTHTATAACSSTAQVLNGTLRVSGSSLNSLISCSAAANSSRLGASPRRKRKELHGSTVATRHSAAANRLSR